MAEYSLTEHFEVKGDWFLPEKPDRTLAGTLAYDGRRLTLELNDRLQPLQGTVTINLGDPLPRHAVVHGITTRGEAVTLFDVWQEGYRIHSSTGGVRTPERLGSFMAVIGGHVTADTKYPEMRCRVPALEAWLSQRTIQPRFANKALTLVADDQKSETTTTQVTDLRWETGTDASLDAHAASLKTQGYVSLAPKEPAPLSWFLEQLLKVTSLLTLLAGHHMPADRLMLTGEALRQSLSVIVIRFGDVNCPYTNERQFFLPRSALGDSFGKLVEQWFSLYAKIQYSCNLALSVMGESALWANVEFLSLMQALEGLHRAMYDGNYMAPSEYDTVRETLVRAIPGTVLSAHRQSLVSKIQYGNEVSLNQRIRGLLDALPVALRKPIIGTDAAKPPRRWIDTRNYYTHWDEALRPNTMAIGEMHKASVRLKHLLRVLFLHVAGVDENLLSSALTNSSEVSQRLIQLNAAEERQQNGKRA